MATQRTHGNSRGRRNRPRKFRNSAQPRSQLRFNLGVFERKLREVLGAESARAPGTPGGAAPSFHRMTRDVAVDYLFAEILSKYNPGGNLPHLKEAATQRFWEAEEMCFWTNLKFSQPHIGISESMPLLESARLEIQALLGQEIPYEEISRNFGFGPGASTRLRRTEGDSVYKYSDFAESTPNTLSLAVAAISCNPIWKQMYPLGVEDHIPVVWGNRVTTVAKNYKTDRTIAIEPCMNMYVQKGLGAVIRRKLKRVGVDLDDQTLNQVAASDLSNATIDFSMASDTVASGLVAFLLPPAWVDLIGLMRSEIGVLPDGTLHRYSKVSSMGNGFTFELESLIFWALARAVVPKDSHSRVRVYGDDVIVPRECAVPFLSLCEYAGFKPNMKKSYWEGPFRESCGKHFHNGHEITPFYIKEPVKTLSDLFLVHNQLWRWKKRIEHLLTRRETDGIDAILRSLRNLAPAQWRKPQLPDGYGDDAFIGSFAACAPNTHPGGWEYFVVKVLASTVENVTDIPDGGCWVKTDLNFLKRRWITPVTYTMEASVEPTRSGRRRSQVLAIPWWAWG